MNHADIIPIFDRAAASILQGDRSKGPPYGQRMLSIKDVTFHEDLPMVVCKDAQGREANITLPLARIPEGVPVTPASVHDCVYVAMLEAAGTLDALPPLQ